MNPRLCLLVIRSSDLPTSKQFYEALGLNFVEEQHGSGPHHLACELGETVFEIYPHGPAIPAGAALRLGFRVADLDAALVATKTAGGSIRSAAKPSPWGRRAVLLDPDGHTIELTEQVSRGTN